MSDQTYPFLFSSRLGLAIIAFFGFVNLYALRVNVSVAIVCMVNHTAMDPHSNSSSVAQNNNSCGAESSHNQISTVNQHEGQLLWDKHLQGVILASFFWGYIFTQLPGGLVSERFGGKYVYGVSMLIAALMTILCPWASHVSPIFFVALRIVIGLAQGVAFPAMHAIWSHWAPPLERSKLVGFSFAGCQIGNVITFPLSGLLCDTIGWESIFYILGGCATVWAVIWLAWVSETPEKHRGISPEEKLYIQDSLRGQLSSHRSKDIREMPWRRIATSLPVAAIVVGHTTANFSTYLILTSLPSFMSQVFNFDIKSNGLFSAIPYIAFFIGINVATFGADYIRQRKWLTTTNVRKLAVVIALVGQSIFFMGLAYSTCGQEYLGVALITIAQGISGIQCAGFMVNHIDVAPQYAGTLLGISNTFATVSGIVAPLVAAELTPQNSRDEWRVVFWVATAILCFGAVFYAIFGSGDVQEWAVSNPITEDKTSISHSKPTSASISTVECTAE